MTRRMAKSAREHLIRLATPPPTPRLYFAVGDVEAHEGYVISRRVDNAWLPENTDGWTYQEITGPHGRVLYEGADEAAAQRALDAFLVCDAATTGAYCYSHNPEGR